MAGRHRLPPWAVVAALAGAVWPWPGVAFASVEVGDPLPNPTMPLLGGGRAELLSRKATASLFVFFRPGQEHSQDGLRILEAIRKELHGRPVRFVGVVSDGDPAEAVRETLREAGVEWPVLVDKGDALYGRLGVRLHPVVGIADRELRLAAYEHYRRINFQEIVLARLKVLLGDLPASAMAGILEPAKATTGSPEAVAGRHLNLARALWKRRSAEKALEWVKKSLATAPSAGAHALLGQILAAEGRCAEALPSFEAALKIDPAEAVALEGRQGCRP